MYEGKALLVAITEVIRHLDTKEEIFEAVAKIANADGVLIAPLEETKEKKNV